MNVALLQTGGCKKFWLLPIVVVTAAFGQRLALIKPTL
jgi:hypothetical protein